MAAKGSTSPAVELEVGDRLVRISNPDRVYPRYDRHANELCVTELASVIWAVEMIDDAVFALDTLMEWAERDERDEGTMPIG
jgi:hypothetical protein